MRILIYKRTHRGDPDASGIFGINDCMGAVRSYHYDAVIGVGGIGDEPRFHKIAAKINWVGIGPHKIEGGRRGPLVVFDHFKFYDTKGPDFRVAAPELASRIYDNNIRIILDNLSVTERLEAMAIVNRAYSSPASRGRFRLGYGYRQRCSNKPQPSAMHSNKCFRSCGSRCR